MTNWKTTATGILGIVVAVAGALYHLLQGQPVDMAATLTAITTGAGLIAASDAPSSSPAPRGFGRLPLLAGMALTLGGCLYLLSPVVARADEPVAGGCLANRTTCFGPSLSLSLLSVDLKTGTTTGTFAPGAGYGVTFSTGKWYELGFNAHVALRDTSEGQRVVPSAVLSFARYLKVGVGYQLGRKDQQRPFLLLGVGTALVRGGG